MDSHTLVKCRVVASRETPPDGQRWCFHLINDGTDPLEQLALAEIVYSWGDYANVDEVKATLGSLAPGAHVQAWRDNGHGAELRMELVFRAIVRGREIRFATEFPKLYRLRDLPMVAELGRPGWTEVVEARVR